MSRTLEMPQEEVVRRASRLMGFLPLDEEITIKRLVLEGVKVKQDDGWYHLSALKGRRKREVGGKILGNSLEVLLKCYLLLREEDASAAQRVA
jgi:hypothetical protein